MFINLKEKTEEKTIVPYLTPVGPLPDATHLVKNSKAIAIHLAIGT